MQKRQIEQRKVELIDLTVHEIRGPLGIVLGCSELMLNRDVDPATTRECARMIHEEAERLDRLINTFLDIHSLEQGKSPLRNEPVALSPVLDTIVQQFREATPTHRVVLSVPGDLPLVLADTERLTQALMNLLSNAITYSPNGGEVRVSAQRVSQEVVVSVRDEGLGIPAEALPHLFTRFYRVNSADRRTIRGNGLGLALCRQIIEAHGGRIWAESDGPQRGSTFKFTLPVARIAHSERPDPDSCYAGSVGLSGRECG